MKFVLFCEGRIEGQALPAFLKRWLDPRLDCRVGIKPVKFSGRRELLDDTPKKARMWLERPDVIGVIALLDLYGPTLYPSHLTGADERFAWAKQEPERAVSHPRFRQFFAVHETEAWLLSDPNVFPRDIGSALPTNTQDPEAVDFDYPPSRLLNDLYKRHTRGRYKKVTHGKELFNRLDPDIAYQRCSRLREFAGRNADVGSASWLVIVDAFCPDGIRLIQDEICNRSSVPALFFPISNSQGTNTFATSSEAHL